MLQESNNKRYIILCTNNNNKQIPFCFDLFQLMIHIDYYRFDGSFVLGPMFALIGRPRLIYEV